ncbi:MAG: DUF881 domain-containing protein [Micromonosporaceae bacterium]|nr:DUF881 domain-containing protein [Micromonosporaceae bacterium]
MEYTPGSSSWARAARRAVGALSPPRLSVRRRGWSVGVPLIAAAAGLLFTATATTANGTSLREDRRPELTQLIEDRRERVAEADRQAARLRAEVEQLTNRLAGPDLEVAAQRARADSYRADAGLAAVRGPAITVRLDDAPRRADGRRPAGASNDDLVVHQQDVQAVVNALWAGGAEAMSIMGERVISTSAVRCVGNTLLLNSRVYSPPFVVTAIGDRAAMRRALDASPGVQLFREAAADFGLGYEVIDDKEATVPAYDATSGLRYAEVPRER